MIRDLRSFFARIVWADFPMLMGIEIVIQRNRLTRLRTEELFYTFQIYSWWDLRKFYIHHLYIRDFQSFQASDALGKVARLYRPIHYPEYAGVFYYILPLYWILRAARGARIFWMAPARALHTRGILYVTPGDRISLAWWRHLGRRPKGR